MEEDFKQLHAYIDQQNHRDAENLLRCMQSAFEKEHHESAIDDYVLNAFDERHGLVEFVTRARNERQFSDAVAECLEILHVLVNRATGKVARHAPAVQQACVRVALTLKPSSKTRTRALELLSLVLQRTDGFASDRSAQELYESLHNCYGNLLNEKTSGVIATVIKALYTLIGKHHGRLRSVDVLCTSVLQRLKVYLRQNDRVAEVAQSFRFFDTYLRVNGDYGERKGLYGCVKDRLRSDSWVKTSHVAAMEFLQHHANLYREEIYNDSKSLEEMLTNYLGHTRDVQKAAYYTLDALYETLGDVIADKNDTQSCIAYLDKFTATLNDERKHGYELRLAIRAFGHFARCCKARLPGDAAATSFLGMILRIERAYLLDFDAGSDRLHYLPDYVRTLSKVVGQLDDVSRPETAVLQKLVVLLVRLSPRLSMHHPDFIVNPILVALSLVRRCQRDASASFLRNVVGEAIVYSCSHAIAYDLADPEAVTYRNYVQVWVGLVNKRAEEVPLPVDEARKMLDEVYDELIRTLIGLISRLNLDVRKVEENAALSDPRVSLEAVKIPDFNIFVNIVDLYVEVLAAAPKTKFSTCARRYLDFAISESKKYPLVSGFYKLIAVGLEICNSLNYFSAERLQRNDVRTYYETIESFVNSILIKTELYKDDLKLACIKVVLAAPEPYVKQNLKRLSPAIVSLFVGSRGNLRLAASGIDTLESWGRFLPRNEYENFLTEIAPTLDSYLRSKVLSENIDTSDAKQRKSRRAPSRRNIASVAEGDLLQLQKRILSFLGNVGGNVRRSLTEANSRIDRVCIGDDLSMRVDLNYDTKIGVYLERFVPRVVDLALHCSERKLQITACETLHAIVIVFLGTARVHDKKSLDGQLRKMFRPLLVLGCDPDRTVQQLVKPLVDQLIHWYSSPSQRNSPKLAIVIESLLEAVTQRDDTALRDFSCCCIHELVKYSLKHCTGRSEEEFSTVKVVIRKIREFCYHSDPVRRLAGSLIFNNVYTLLREEKFIIDTYWLELFQYSIYNLSRVEESDDYDSLSHVIQSVDHLERVFREKATVFNRSSSKRKVPNGFHDGTLGSVITAALNYRHAKNRRAKARIYKFYYQVAPFVPNNPIHLTSPPYLISESIFQDPTDSNWSPSDVTTFLRKLLHILDTELSVYEHEKRKHCYEIDKTKLLQNLQGYLERIHPYNLRVIARKTGDITDFENATFKTLKFEVSKCTAQYLITSAFYKENDLQDLAERYGPKLLVDFLFGNYDSIEELDERILYDLLEKTAESENLSPLAVEQINDYVSKNHSILGDYRENVPKKQKRLLQGMRLLTKSRLNEKVNVDVYSKDILGSIFNKLVSAVTNYTIRITEEVKSYCRLAIELYIERDDIVFLLDCICDRKEVHDVESNETTTFGLYLYNTFKDSLLPVVSKNFDTFLNTLKFQDDIYFFTKEILQHISSSSKKLDHSNIIVDVTTTIFSNWSMYKRYHIKQLQTVAEGLQLLETISELSRNLEVPVTDDVITWILSCFDLSVFRVLPQRLYRYIEQILGALPLLSNTCSFPLLKNELESVRNDYFTRIAPELNDAATIVVNKSFQISAMTGSAELFGFSCDIFVASNLRKDINVEEYCKVFMIAASNELQYETLRSVYEKTLSEFTENSLRSLDLIVSNLLRYGAYEIFQRFYVEFINDILGLLKKSDGTKEDVIGKSIGYILIKCLFSRISTRNFGNKSCEITKAAYTVTTGLELVKNLFMISVNYLKEKIPDSSELREPIRICKCHSYNALISVISNGVKNNVPNYAVYYDKLFYREVDGENILWKNLIDLSKRYDFPLIFDRLPEKRTQLVSIRTRNQGAVDVRYIESQTLYSSTLSEDFRRYDFTKTILRSQEAEMSYVPDGDEVEMQITVEGEEINTHECIANVCGLIRQIHDDGIFEGVPSPKWVEYINNDLKSERAHVNVKLHLLKIIEKEQEIFKPYAELLLQTIVDLIVNEVVGNEINYFVADLVIMLTSWGEDVRNPESISKLVLFLMQKTNREMQAVKKYHLDLLKLVVETWRGHVEVPADFISSELEKLVKSKKVEVIVHFCSIFLANDLAPWGDNLKKFASRLVACLESDSGVVQRTCSETIGMALALLERRAHPEFNQFKEAVVKKMRKFNLGKYISCLQGFTKSLPQMCDSFIGRLIGDFSATPESKRVALQIFSERTEALHEHPDFPFVDFEKLISDYDDTLKILGMDVIRKSIPKMQIEAGKRNPNAKTKLTKAKLAALMSSLAKLSNSNNRVCRSAMYDIFIEIEETIQDNDTSRAARDVLLQGLTDADKEIQTKLTQFFSAKLPKNICSNFLSILKEMYKPELEDRFLGCTARLLLKDLDTSTALFDTPLQDVDFSERPVTDDWRGRHSTYIPLFASTYHSQESGGSENSPGSFNLRATPMDMDFEPTYRSDSIASERQEMLRSAGGDETEEDPFKAPLPVGKRLQKRRFERDASRTERQIALGQLRRKERGDRDRADRTKRRREKATIYRRYRDGEIPDIEVTLADLIAPLSELVEHDAHLAEVFYTSFFHEVLSQSDDKQAFVTEIAQTIDGIFKSSTLYNPYFMGALLNAVVKFPGHAFSPTTIATVASNSGLLSSGVLVLEEYLITSEQDEDAEVPAKRNPASDPRLKIWVKLADLYRELQDWDMVKAIFLRKMDCDADMLEAIDYESRGQWWKAEERYLRSLRTDFSADRKDFYYESYFRCFAEMSKWDEMGKAVRSATSDNAWEDLWDRDWNQRKLLPWYISSEVRESIGDDEKLKGFAGLLNAAMTDGERAEYLKQHFSEELGFLHLINDNLDRALYYVKNNLERFLGEWQGTSPMLASLRTNKLTKIMNTADMSNFISAVNVGDRTVLARNALQLGGQWQSVARENLSSIVPLETRHVYRSTCLSRLQEKLGDPDETWRKIALDMDLALLETAVDMKNYHVAKKYINYIKENYERDDDVQFQLVYAKVVMLRTTYLPSGSPNLYDYVKGAYETIVSSLDTSSGMPLDLKLSAVNTLYDVLFDFAPNVSQFESQVRQLIPDLTSCTTDGVKEYAVAKLRDSLDTCAQASSSELPLMAESYVKLAQFYRTSPDRPDQLIVSVLRAMHCGSREARQMFPCLLDIDGVGRGYRELFLKESRNLPEYLFIQWIPQLLSKLDSDCAFVIDKVILKIAESYPQSIMFAYRLSKEKYDLSSKTEDIRGHLQNVLERLDRLLANEAADNLIEALSCVASAKNAALFHITNLQHACLSNDGPLFKTHMDCLNAFCRSVNTDDPASKIGPVHKRIVELSRETLKLRTEQFNPERLLSKLDNCKMAIRRLEDAASKRLSRFESKLSYYSPYLEYFMDTKLEDGSDLEIPGQYRGDARPQPRYHVTIAGFHPEVLAMSSARRPIRVKIIGNDGREHPFLVKVGEDLRQDQRVEQMFSLMNEIFDGDAACRERNLKISTYQVVPLTANVGLIEWVENAVPLAQFLNENPPGGFERRNDAARKRHGARYSRPTSDDHSRALNRHGPEAAASIYRELVNMIPSDVVRRALRTLSADSESFVSIRDAFVASYATTCVANWILGIGDRHLSNTLLRLESARTVDIDFGHAFGSGVQIQAIPELVPFRLTPHIAGAARPLGPIERTMVHVLGALRKNRGSLTSTVRVFVSEPSMDWVRYRKLENQAMGYNWRGEEKVRHAELKLAGASSADVMVEELRRRTVDARHTETYVRYVRGTAADARSRLTGTLSVEDQVRCLLDHATDPNLLCRMFCGWDPWV